MIYRKWYAQLDVFDTIRRYLAILSHWTGEAPSRNRLYVSDFYFSSPSLLHLTHMNTEVRRAFVSLKVAKPEQSFIEFPSPPILYNRMGGIQAQAMHNLIGRGLLDFEKLHSDQCLLSEFGIEFAKQMCDRLVLPGEYDVLQFIVKDFAKIGTDRGGLRAATGLRRLGA